MRVRLALAALVACAGSVALSATPASACAASVCETVNEVVCRPYLHIDCLA